MFRGLRWREEENYRLSRSFSPLCLRRSSRVDPWTHAMTRLRRYCFYICSALKPILSVFMKQMTFETDFGLIIWNFLITSPSLGCDPFPFPTFQASCSGKRNFYFIMRIFLLSFYVLTYLGHDCFLNKKGWATLETFEFKALN